MEQAQNIEVRVFVKFVIDCGAVQNRGSEVFAGCQLQTAHQLLQILFSVHFPIPGSLSRASLLPAAACSAASRCSSAEAAKTTTPAASAIAAAPTAHGPTPPSSPITSATAIARQTSQRKEKS